MLASPDYHFHHADGRTERGDLYSPTTGDKARLAATDLSRFRNPHVRSEAVDRAEALAQALEVSCVASF